MIIGCSSGGGDGAGIPVADDGETTTDDGTTTDNGGGTTTSEISGSVSGTTVIAVNESGDVVASDDTEGKTPDADGNFPFTLSDIPVGINVRVFLITGAGIHPMYFHTDDPDSIPDTNVFSLGTGTDINLGFIDTESPLAASGWAIPQTSPTDTSGVTSFAAVADIPETLHTPDTSEFSLAQLLEKGVRALKNEWLEGANTYLKKAVEVAGSDTSNDADTARFFYAMVRVAATGNNMRSDGDSSDLNRVGDYLDKLGCDDSELVRSNLDAVNNDTCPEVLSADAPTGADYQSLLYNIIGQELKGAIGNLDAISESFNRRETFNEDPPDGERVEVEFDYGDVLVLRAGMKGSLALIAIQQAYDANADPVAEQTADADPTDTTEAFLSRNLNALVLNDASKLAEARNLLIGGGNDLLSAITSIKAEVTTDPDQTDDLVNFLGDEEDTVESVAAEIEEGRVAINDAINCLNGSTDCTDDNGTPLDTSDDTVFTLQPLFSGSIDFSAHLPVFSGDIPGNFPDGTLAGSIIRGFDLNEDISPADGIPDILNQLFSEPALLVVPSPPIL